MWAFVTLGVLWIEQPRLGAPEQLRARLEREAHTLAGAALLRQVEQNTTCSLDSLSSFDMDLSLCNVSLSTEPLLILERDTDASGLWMRIALVQHKRITRAADVHVAIDADASAVLSALMTRMFSDYGEVLVNGRTGEELFVDGRWMGGVAEERMLRLPPGSHDFEMRRLADVVPLGRMQVVARSEFARPQRLEQTLALSTR